MTLTQCRAVRVGVPHQRRHRAATTPRPPWLDRLTDREREVLRQVARGLSNDEIAVELFIAPTTVKTHVARLLMKVEARDRVQLVVAAYSSGFVAA